MFVFLILFSSVLFDAEFIKTLLDCDEAAWQRLGDETIPPEQDVETFAELADKLTRFVPRSFLKEHVTDIQPPNRGEVLYLEGRIVLSEKYEGKIPAYLCKIILGDVTEAVIFTPSVPQGWKQNDRIAAFGVYIKSYNNTPVFVSPAIQWFPDTWLGNLGFDVGSLDQVPVSRVIDEEVKQNDDETNRRLFKFTESDSEPFYGLLQAISATPDGWLEEEAKKHHAETPFTVTDLFNRPHETRGKPVLLSGTAKRIVPTPVTDNEVLSLFGIDHYYQIYLFTEQSRGNPIVVCVHSLPKGIPAGNTNDFAEQITVAAIPYKLWVYETPTGPHYAPVLVGRSPTWHPKLAGSRPIPESATTFSFTLFFALILIWFGCRYWRF